MLLPKIEHDAAATLLVIRLGTTSPIPLMRAYQATYTPTYSVDWHQFSNLLETLTCYKITEYAPGRDLHNHHIYRLTPDYQTNLSKML